METSDIEAERFDAFDPTAGLIYKSNTVDFCLVKETISCCIKYYYNYIPVEPYCALQQTSFRYVYIMYFFETEI